MIPNNSTWYLAVDRAERFIAQYGSDRCLSTAKRLVSDIENKDLSAFRSKDSDPCADEILTYACTYCGIRQLYAAFLASTGNQMGAELQYRAYQFDASRASQDLKDLLGFKKSDTESDE